MPRSRRSSSFRTAKRWARGANVIPLPWVSRRRPATAKQGAALPHDPDDYPVSDRTLLTIGAFLAFFIVGCVWLLETMRSNAQLEDCLMSGRKNCAPIAIPAPER